MVFTTKTALLSHQMALSAAINDVSASIHPITQRIEERQEKKIGKIYYPQQDCQRKRFLSTLLPTTWICEKSSMFRCCNRAWTRSFTHPLMRSDIPKGLYEWKLKTNKPLVTCLSFGTMPLTRESSPIYYVRTFTDDGGEVGANQWKLCHLMAILDS